MEFKTYSINEYLSSFNGSYEEIESITINRFDFFKEIVDVDLKELIYLTNLKELTLCNLYIDEDDLSIFNSIKINKLELINCEVTDEIVKILNDYELDSLILDNTNINLIKINKDINNLTLINLPYNQLNININNLDLSRAIIDKNKLDFNNVLNLILSKKQYNDNVDYYKGINNSLNIIVKTDVRDSGEINYE